MRTIIAGSRSIRDLGIVYQAVEESEFDITEVVSGKARGVDSLGEAWAKRNGVSVQSFEADWENLDAPGAVVRTKDGRSYNARAGHDRNQHMAEYADALILVWDGKSSGSKDMLTRARKSSLQIYEFIV